MAWMMCKTKNKGKVFESYIFNPYLHLHPFCYLQAQNIKQENNLHLLHLWNKIIIDSISIKKFLKKTIKLSFRDVYNSKWGIYLLWSQGQIWSEVCGGGS